MSAFEELGLMPELIRAVEDLGWMLPSPIQAEAIPLILGGGDVMAAAETGSGKTGAFSLPVLQIAHESLRNQDKASDSGRTPEPQKIDFVMSNDDRDNIVAVSPDGTRVQSRAEKSWGGCRAAVGCTSGRVYYEAMVTEDGLCRVGWSSVAASLDLGTDKQGFGFGGTGKKSHARNFDSYGQPFGLGDTVGCLLDCELGEIAFTLNGQHLGKAFDLPAHLRGQAIFPAVCIKNAELLVNLGATPFKYAPPPTFTSLVSAPTGSLYVPGATPTPSTSRSTEYFGRTPVVLILEPSRDLAEQTGACVTSYGKYLASPAVSCVTLVGGVDPNPQVRALKQGADVVVGTPGRMVDFMQSGKLVLDKVRFFVLDEADRLMDNKDAIMQIFQRLNKSGTGANRLQALLFSATLHSDEVQELAKVITNHPILVDLKGANAVPESVDHVRVVVDPREDRSWLQAEPKVPTDNVHIHDQVGPTSTSKECMSEAVKRLKPRLLVRLADEQKMDPVLVFCRTNYDCDNLEAFLGSLGGGARAFTGKVESGKSHTYSCVVLAGARTMDERRSALTAFKEGDVRFLICTDVAARGIDIAGLPYVINMTLPDKSEDYIHRIGRVGRVGRLGLAVSLISSVPEKVWYCSKKGYKPWLNPTKQDLRTNEEGGHTIWYDEQQLLKDIEARLGRAVPALPPDMSLPPAITARLAGAGAGGAYGQERGGGASAAVAEHLLEIRSDVESLAALEVEAQHSFLAMVLRWSLRSGATPARVVKP